ncbi:MAG: CoA pyrophosphatase [Saprospiraceae bacterium]
MNLIETIKQNIQNPLPGRDAQNKMSHAIRKHATLVPENARKAAVLGMLYPKREEWHIALIERQSSHPDDKHGGQISFPGGMHEMSDPSLQYTALRETFEEIGVPVDDINPLGPLTPMYIPVSNFQVYPFLGHLEELPLFQPQPSEVRSILEVPIHQFSNPEILKTKDIKVSERMTLKNVPYYDIQGHTLWGATAMMIREMLEVMEIA